MADGAKAAPFARTPPPNATSLGGSAVTIVAASALFATEAKTEWVRRLMA